MERVIFAFIFMPWYHSRLPVVANISTETIISHSQRFTLIFSTVYQCASIVSTVVF